MKIVDLCTVSRAQADQVIRLYQSLSDSYHAKGDDENAQKYRATLLDFLSSKGWQDKVREVRDHIAPQKQRVVHRFRCKRCSRHRKRSG